MNTLLYVLISSMLSFLYFSIAVLLLNTSLLFYTFSSSSPLFQKGVLLLSLITSSFTAFNSFNMTLLLITSCLIGMNVYFSLVTLKRMKKLGGMSISFGSASVLGVFSAGCASCGFSAFSLFGLSGTIALFPFRGGELYFIAIGLLLFTLYYNIKKLRSPIFCKIKKS